MFPSLPPSHYLCIFYCSNSNSHRGLLTVLGLQGFIPKKGILYWLLQSCDLSLQHSSITPVTPVITIWSRSIMWLFPDTSLSPYVPQPVPQPQYTVLHSCGALQQTCVPAFVHSLPHEIIFMPIFTLYFIHSNPMPPCFPLLYVPLHMTYAHFPHYTPISPNTIMSSDPTCLSI